MLWIILNITEPWRMISNNVVCATRKCSDQPAHKLEYLMNFELLTEHHLELELSFKGGCVFVRVCLYLLCGHLLGKGWPLGSRLWCLTVSLSLSHQVWYLIVSIPDLCTLTYFAQARLSMPHCWKSHVMAQLLVYSWSCYRIFPVFNRAYDITRLHFLEDISNDVVQ